MLEKPLDIALDATGAQDNLDFDGDTGVGKEGKAYTTYWACLGFRPKYVIKPGAIGGREVDLKDKGRLGKIQV